MTIINDYAELTTALHERMNTVFADIAAGNAWLAALGLVHVAVYMALEIAGEAGEREEIGNYLREETPALIVRTLARFCETSIPSTSADFSPVDTV